MHLEIYTSNIPHAANNPGLVHHWRRPVNRKRVPPIDTSIGYTTGPFRRLVAPTKRRVNCASPWDAPPRQLAYVRVSDVHISSSCFTRLPSRNHASPCDVRGSASSSWWNLNGEGGRRMERARIVIVLLNFLCVTRMCDRISGFHFLCMRCDIDWYR